MMMRSAGSEGLILGVSPPLFAITARPPLPAYPASLAPNPRRHPAGAAILADHYGPSVPGRGRDSMKSVFAKLV